MSDQPVKKIVEYGAPWCAPCKTLKVILSKLPKTITIEEINIDSNPEEASRQGIVNVPTLIFYIDGKQVDRTTGASSGTIETINRFVEMKV